MSKKKKSKKKNRPVWDSLRKPLAPPTKKFKTRKGELERKQKHKGKDEEV